MTAQTELQIAKALWEDADKEASFAKELEKKKDQEQAGIHWDLWSSFASKAEQHLSDCKRWLEFLKDHQCGDSEAGGYVCMDITKKEEDIRKAIAYHEERLK